MLPRISIVTPCFNSEDYIEETICSILDQKYPNLEYIIIDGGSTDKTIGIIQKYQHFLSYWVSEPDRGQAHAINKGISICSGHIFNWINSDDILSDNALQLVAANWNPSRLLASCVTNFTNITDPSSFIAIQNKNLRFMGSAIHSNRAVFHQPGLWANLSTIKSLAPLDDSLKFSFDTMLYTQYMLLYPEVTYIPETTVYFRVHDDSKSVKDRQYFYNEKTVGYTKLLLSPQIMTKDKISLSFLCIRRLYISQYQPLINLPKSLPVLVNVIYKIVFWLDRKFQSFILLLLGN